MQFLNEALLVGASQGLLLSVVILSLPSSNQIASRLLALYVGLASLHLALLYINYLDLSQTPSATLRFAFTWRVLSWPALYLYVAALTDSNFKLELRHLKHLWVLLAILVWLGAMANDPTWTNMSTMELWDLPSTTILSVYQSLLAGGYAFASWRLLRNHQVRLQQAVSMVDDVDLGWLRWLVAALMAVSLLHLGLDLLRELGVIGPASKAAANFVMTMLLVYLISIGGLRQPQVFTTQLRSALTAIEDPDDDSATSTTPDYDNSTSDTKPGKYRKSGLDDSQREEIWLQLQILLHQEQPYLDAGLDLPKLARQLSIRPQELSEAINTQYGGSFYDLINNNRIEAAKALLVEPEQQHRKMFDIALSVGFSSESTFYKHFKKLTGLTPTKYRQEQFS